jgi:hypothetical protein
VSTRDVQFVREQEKSVRTNSAACSRTKICSSRTVQMFANKKVFVTNSANVREQKSVRHEQSRARRTRERSPLIQNVEIIYYSQESRTKSSNQMQFESMNDDDAGGGRDGTTTTSQRSVNSEGAMSQTSTTTCHKLSGRRRCSQQDHPT